jgi:F0F1-type ATP synthase alpha subunit
VTAKLKQLYPQDVATGYKVGDLRGAFTITEVGETSRRKNHAYRYRAEGGVAGGIGRADPAVTKGLNMLGQETVKSPFLGVVVSVRGSVVDIRFDEHLPPIYSVLLTGPEKQIVIEVLAQQDARHVRGIALTPTQGLARGMAVEDTGGPLKAPVGKAVLSRMFDVFGNTIDREAALSDVEWRSVHRAPPSLARRSTKSEVFETGIKVIDVLVPLERGC